MSIKFVSGLNKVLAKIRADNERNVRDATLHLYGAVKKKLRGTRSGHMYRLPPPAKGKEYQASAAGEPPAVRTGDLLKSIRFDVSGTKGRVGTDQKYAPALERGTSQMKPRPFMGATIAEEEQAIIRILSRS